MKFNVKITKDILKRSMYCGSAYAPTKEIENNIAQNCAFAVALSELIPNVKVGSEDTYFCTEEGVFIAKVTNTGKQFAFIISFDSLHDHPSLRLELPEQEFEVEIPDKVIEYYYGDAVTAAQKIADSSVLSVAEVI